MNKPSKYWMVHRLDALKGKPGDGPVFVSGGSTTRMHDSGVEATQEAQRLARANIGVRFVVLEAQLVFVATAEVKVEALVVPQMEDVVDRKKKLIVDRPQTPDPRPHPHPQATAFVVMAAH